LVTIFKEHFERKPKCRKDPYDDVDPIKGEFIDFAEAVLAECEIPYSGRRAIFDAYSKGRRGRTKATAQTEKNERFWRLD
jgi:hypothetical protein